MKKKSKDIELHFKHFSSRLSSLLFFASLDEGRIKSTILMYPKRCLRGEILRRAAYIANQSPGKQGDEVISFAGILPLQKEIHKEKKKDTTICYRGRRIIHLRKIYLPPILAFI